MPRSSGTFFDYNGCMKLLFFGLCLALSSYDLKAYRLPNALVLAVLTLAVIRDPYQATAGLLGFGLMAPLYWITRELGWGDVKLFAALSAFVGWGQVWPLLVRSFLLAGLLALLLSLKKGITRKSVIPLGPCLCLAALLSL